MGKEPKFTKEQLANSKKFRDQQDLIKAVLKEGVEYTHSEAENQIQKYLKGTVK